MKKILYTLILYLLLISCKDNNTITIVLDWTPNTNHTGLFVAKEKGFFKEEGLNVDIVQPPEGSSTQLIGVGKAQMGISFQDTLAKYFSAKEKLPVTVIATILQHNTSGLVSLKKSNINSFKDLEGKTYGTWDDVTEQAMIKKLVSDEGGDFSKINIIPYSWDILKALQTDTDATWIYYAWDGIALEVSGLEFNYLEAKVSPELDYYTPVIIANNTFISENEETVKKIMKAIKKGYLYSVNNPEESVDILIKNSPELSDKKEFLLKSQLWINKYYLDENGNFGNINSERWNRFYKWLYDNKIIENPIDKDFGFTNKFLGE